MALTGDAARVAKLAQSLGASKSKAEGAVSTALKSSGGSSKTLSYKPGSLETMTVAQAKAAGKEAEYNQMVSGFFPGGAVKPLDAGGGKTFSEIASKIPVDAIGEQKPIYVPPVAESPFKPDYLTQPTTTTETKPTESATTPEFDFIKKELEGLQIPSAEKDFLKLEKELQIRQKEQAVSDANARLTAVTNQQQADIMAIRNQSSTEGGTAGILSAREDAINRSAVIKALPIQAEVALAQDNLKYATDRLDTLSSLRREDNQNKYERSVKLLEMTYNDMTAKQKEKADLAKEMRQRQYEITDSNISRQDSWAKVFAESNQPGLMSRVTGLDPADPNFRNKLSTVIGGYAPQGDSVDDEYKKLQIAKMKKELGLDINSDVAKMSSLAALKGQVEQINALNKDKGLRTAVGSTWLARTPTGEGFWGTTAAILANVLKAPLTLGIGTGKDITSEFSSARTDFIASVSEITKGLTLQNLIDAKSKGATFGALSIPELVLLEQSATKLNTWALTDSKGKVTGYDTSEKSFRKELDNIMYYANLDYVLKGGKPEDVGIFTQPDGSLWMQNSDGTYKSLDLNLIRE